MGATGPAGPAGPVGATGPAGEPAPAPGEEATSPTVGYLRIESVNGGVLDETFEVVSFRAGVEVTGFGSASGGSANRPELSELEVEVLANTTGLPAAFGALAQGESVEVTLSRPDPAGGPPLPFMKADVASLTTFAPRAARNPNQSSIVELTFALGDLTLEVGSSSARFDRLSNTTSCQATPCGCSGSPLPIHFASTQGLSLAVPATHLPVERLDSLATSSVNVGSGSGGVGSGRTSLKGASLSMPLSEEAVCLFYKVTSLGKLVDATRFEVMSPLSAQFGPLYQHTHTLECEVHPSTLLIASNENGDVVAHASIIAGAETHTYRAFDPASGAVAVTGEFSWSQTSAQASKSCQ